MLEGRARLEMDEVDIVRNPDTGDLLDADRQQFYIDRVREGFYDVAILSPPCNSWTRLLFANEWGPSVVRDRDFPWGRPDNSPEEHVRADVGNRFVVFCCKVVEAPGVAKTPAGGVVRVL